MKTYTAAYDYVLMDDAKEMMKYLFKSFLSSEYDYFSGVKEFMQNSWIRQKMDRGIDPVFDIVTDQVKESLDYGRMEKGDNGYMTEEMSTWLANVYATSQWWLNIPSRDLVLAAPPEDLCKCYDQLKDKDLLQVSDFIKNGFIGDRMPEIKKAMNANKELVWTDKTKPYSNAFGFRNTEQYAVAYDYALTDGARETTRQVFRDFLSSGKDYFSCVREFMQNSGIRARMDKGDEAAFDATARQMEESVDLSQIEENDNSYMTGEKSDWMADVYTMSQWWSNAPSSELVVSDPPEHLCKGYEHHLKDKDILDVCDYIQDACLHDYKQSADITNFTNNDFFLSNYYPCPVMYDGIQYYSAEAAYQAQKCADKNDRLAFANLDADDAKKLGRKTELRPGWEIDKFLEMKAIVKTKFDQNPRLKEKLLATGDRHLEEGNDWGDKVWGTVDGEGANSLGRILMGLRDEYRVEEIEKKPEFER